MSGYHRVKVATNLEKLVVAVIVSAVFFATAVLLVPAVVLFASIFAVLIVVAVVTAAAVVLLIVAAVAVAVIWTFVVAVATAALRSIWFASVIRCWFFLYNTPKCQRIMSNRPPPSILASVPLITALEPNPRRVSKAIASTQPWCTSLDQTPPPSLTCDTSTLIDPVAHLDPEVTTRLSRFPNSRTRIR